MTNANVPAVATVTDALPEPVKRRGLTEASWRTLKNSVFPGATNESVLMAVDYCIARGLDVMKRPCHIVPMKVTDKATGEELWREVIMPGIYDLRTTAARTGLYAGQDEPAFGPTIEYKGVQAPEWCKVTVYRVVGGQRCPFPHVERFAEAVGTKSNGQVNSMWSRRPFGQLAKVAEAGALRKAFPEELGGQHAAEELEGTTFDEVTVTTATPTPATLSRQEALKAALAARDAAPVIEAEVIPTGGLELEPEPERPSLGAELFDIAAAATAPAPQPEPTESNGKRRRAKPSQAAQDDDQAALEADARRPITGDELPL